jgi:tetratricopeptide (TPR) repeat protein
VNVFSFSISFFNSTSPLFPTLHYPSNNNPFPYTYSSTPEALKLNPTDAGLASRIGRALITTHDYARALRYYEAAVAAADPSRTSLFHELIELYVKLSKYDEVPKDEFDFWF